MSKKTIVLAIIDGWGIGRGDFTNSIHIAQPKTINKIKSRYQGGSLQASGLAVGLPWGEEGNSEVGHLTIGAGKVTYQHFPKINLAVKNKSFYKNKTLLDAINHATKNNSAINLIGLVSEGNIHASIGHLLALIELVRSRKKDLPIKLHIFSDGRDSPPRSVLELLTNSNLIPVNEKKGITISSISGRYFAMDRDKHWDRTQEAYDVIVGRNKRTDNLKKHIEKQYNRGLEDQHLPPAGIGPKNNSLNDNDAVIFFNFREDRMRQLAKAFTDKNFDKFPTAPLKNVSFTSFTKYSNDLSIPFAFPPEKVKNPLGKVLAENNKLQLRVAETEKYAHVTYFFNGLNEEPMKNEYRILIPSRNVARHDRYPKMMAREISDRVIQAIGEREMDFILVNFANPDMVAHTGNFEATVEAIKTVDEQIDKIMKTVLSTDAVLMITSDHGNAERMLNPITGAIETKHDPSPVPFYLVGKKFESSKNNSIIRRIERETNGVLSDVAPTVLELMNVPKPKEMTGNSLLGRLM